MQVTTLYLHPNSEAPLSIDEVIINVKFCTILLFF